MPADLPSPVLRRRLSHRRPLGSNFARRTKVRLYTIDHGDMDFQMWQFKKQIVEQRAPGEQGRLSHSAKTLGLAVSRFRYLI